MYVHFRPIDELDLLDAYREAKIPSSTLFRRGEYDPRTLGNNSYIVRGYTVKQLCIFPATLINWNGRECPFADFSAPERREGVREKSRSDSGMGSFTLRFITWLIKYVVGSSKDENDNSLSSSAHCGSRDGEMETKETKGVEDDQSAVFNRLISYMETIQERLV